MQLGKLNASRVGLKSVSHHVIKKLAIADDVNQGAAVLYRKCPKAEKRLFHGGVFKR